MQMQMRLRLRLRLRLRPLTRLTAAAGAARRLQESSARTISIAHQISQWAHWSVLDELSMDGRWDYRGWDDAYVCAYVCLASALPLLGFDSDARESEIQHVRKQIQSSTQNIMHIIHFLSC